MSYAFADLAQYEITAVNNVTYNVTLSTGFLALAENVDVVVSLRDDLNRFAVVTGYRSGTQFHVKQYLSGSESALPTFGTGGLLRSTVGANLLNRSFQKACLLVFGQSNAEGFAGPTDSRIEFADSRITMNQYQSRDSSGNLLPDDDIYLAAPPLPNYQQNGNDSVPPALHAARGLIEYAGYKSVEIQEGSQGSTAYGNISSGATAPGGQWVKGGTHYQRLLTMTLEFLNRSDSNVMGAMYWALGESDTIQGETNQTQMATYIDDSINNFRLDLIAGLTNGTAETKGINTFPIILAGMPDVFRNGIYSGAATPIQNAIVDTPNRLAYTAFLDVAGLTNADIYHHSADALRTIGRDLFMPAYFTALANIQDVTSVSLPIGLATETNVALPVTTTFEQVQVGLATETNVALEVTASQVVPVTVDALFKKGVGITDVSGKIDTWADQVNSYDITQTTDSRRPTLTSGAAVFNDAHFMNIPNDLQGDRAVGGTYILDVETSVTGDFMLGAASVRCTNNDPATFMPMGTTDQTASSGTVSGQGRVIWAGTIDVVAGTAKVWIDDVLVIDASGLSFSGSNTGTFYLGGLYFGGNPSFLFTGTFYNLAFKRAPMTKNEIDTIVSTEFVT